MEYDEQGNDNLNSIFQHYIDCIFNKLGSIFVIKWYQLATLLGDMKSFDDDALMLDLKGKKKN